MWGRESQETGCMWGTEPLATGGVGCHKTIAGSNAAKASKNIVAPLGVITASIQTQKTPR